MDETAKGETQPVERLLRRWGAEEAAQVAGRRAPPTPTFASRPSAPAWQRWAPLAAAAAVLGVAAALFGLSRWDRPGPPAPRSGDNRLTALAAELGAVRNELARAQADLAETRRAAAAERTRLESDLQRVGAEADSRVAAALQEAGRQTAELKAALAGQQAHLDRLAGEVKEVGDRAAKDREALLASEREREALRAEVVRQAGALGDLAAAAARTTARLEEIQRQYAGLARDVGSLQLAAAAAEAGGVEAVQAAARQTDLVGRSAAVRPRVRSGEARRLLDALEVLLTRLDFLDADRADRVQSFADLMRRGLILERLDQVLASGEEDPEVRAWFLEVRLLLGRAERVG